MESSKKIILVAKDGSIEGKFIQLEDFTQTKYATDDILAFVKYAEQTNEDISRIFYNERGAILIPRACRITSDIIARCTIDSSPWVQLLTNVNSRPIKGAEETEKFLRRMRKYFTDGCLHLYDWVRNFTVSKALKIERKKEANGNYRYLCQLEAGPNDFVPLDQIQFKIPIIGNLDTVKTVEMGFSVSYELKNGVPEIEFLFENLNLTQDIIDAKREILEELLEQCAVPSYWGDATIKIQTDEWKYKPKSVVIETE